MDDEKPEQLILSGFLFKWCFDRVKESHEVFWEGTSFSKFIVLTRPSRLFMQSSFSHVLVRTKGVIERA